MTPELSEPLALVSTHLLAIVWSEIGILSGVYPFLEGSVYREAIMASTSPLAWCYAHEAA